MNAPHREIATLYLDFRHIAMLYYLSRRVMLKEAEIYDRPIYEALLAVGCVHHTYGYVMLTPPGAELIVRNTTWYRWHVRANRWIAPWVGLDRVRRLMAKLLSPRKVRGQPQPVQTSPLGQLSQSATTRPKDYQWSDPITNTLQ